MQILAQKQTLIHTVLALARIAVQVRRIQRRRMASTRKRTHVSEAVQQLLAELRLTFTSPDRAHRKTATRIHGYPVSIPQRKQVNTRSVQAFKPVKDFRGIEGNNAVLSVVLARNTQILE